MPCSSRQQINQAFAHTKKQTLHLGPRDFSPAAPSARGGEVTSPGARGLIFAHRHEI